MLLIGVGCKMIIKLFCCALVCLCKSGPAIARHLVLLCFLNMCLRDQRIYFCCKLLVLDFGAGKAINHTVIFLLIRFVLCCQFAGRLRNSGVRLSCSSHEHSGPSGKD